jgi:hypothetical protein
VEPSPHAQVKQECKHDPGKRLDDLYGSDDETKSLAVIVKELS